MPRNFPRASNVTSIFGPCPSEERTRRPLTLPCSSLICVPSMLNLLSCCRALPDECRAASRGGWPGDHREALERGLGRLTARTQEEISALHVTPGAGSEHRRDRHVRARRLSCAGVELRELERLDDGVARLARGPRLAVVLAGPPRQRLATEDVD